MADTEPKVQDEIMAHDEEGNDEVWRTLESSSITLLTCLS